MTDNIDPSFPSEGEGGVEDHSNHTTDSLSLSNPPPANPWTGTPRNGHLRGTALGDSVIEEIQAFVRVGKKLSK